MGLGAQILTSPLDQEQVDGFREYNILADMGHVYMMHTRLRNKVEGM